MLKDFEFSTVLEIFLGTLFAGAVLTLISILLGKWIGKMKDHFEAV